MIGVGIGLTDLAVRGAGTIGSPSATYNVLSATYDGVTSFNEAPAPLNVGVLPSTDSFTMNVWCKLDAFTNTMQIVNCDGDATNYWDLFYTGFNDNLCLRVKGDRVNFDGTVLTDGEFHLISAIKNNDPSIIQGGGTGELVVMVDGSRLEAVTVTRILALENALAMSPANAPITFGRRSRTATQYLEGSVSFASWHVGTVFTEEMARSMYLGGVPLCLEDSSFVDTITEAWDLSTYTGSIGSLVGLKGLQNLTIETAVTYVDQGLTVRCGGGGGAQPVNSATFNGTSHYIPAGDLFDYGDEFSFSMWVYIDSTGSNNGYILDRIGSSSSVNKNYRLQIVDPSLGTLRFLVQAVGGFAEAEVTAPVDQWVYVYMERRPLTDITLTVNNSITDTVPFTFAISTGGVVDTEFGKSQSGNFNYFKGGIASFIAGTRPLTAGEQTAVYNAGQNKCWANLLAENPSLSDLQAYLPMYNGADTAIGQELNDLINSNNLSNPAGTPFTDQALTVECT